jgi:hypothetical protein
MPLHARAEHSDNQSYPSIMVYLLPVQASTRSRPSTCRSFCRVVTISSIKGNRRVGAEALLCWPVGQRGEGRRGEAREADMARCAAGVDPCLPLLRERELRAGRAAEGDRDAAGEEHARAPLGRLRACRTGCRLD